MRKLVTYYLIPLDFELGYSIVFLADFTKVTSFDGRLVYVLDFFTEKSLLPAIKITEKDSICFGPIPVNRLPNTRGKNSWRKLGSSYINELSAPCFKITNFDISLFNALDWSEVKGWKRLLDFNVGIPVVSYEEVRYLETNFLVDLQTVQTRATFQYLLNKKIPVHNYYDFSEGPILRLYIQHVNTLFPKKTVVKLISSIDGIPNDT